MNIWRYEEPVEILGNRYVLERRLGEGGMAEVLLARDEQLHRKVAIKLLKDKEVDMQMQNRFIKEAGQTVGWQHPHILRVYDHVQTHQIAQGKPSLFYIVMEYVSGGDLQKRLTPGEPYPSLASVFTIFRQICGAVHYAHIHRVIHRDIKPSNILFRRPRTGSEEAVLSDFGLAVQIDATHHTFEHAGTLAYMAPEQVRNQAIPASDIFALGVTLYQLCTGELPFHRELKDINAMLMGTEPEPLLPSLLNPALPPGLDRPILRALRADPAARYRSAESFWNALARTQLASGPWLINTPPSSTPTPARQRTRPVPGTPTEAMVSEASTGTRMQTGQRDSHTLVRRASRTNTPPASTPRSLNLSGSASTTAPRRSSTTPPPAAGRQTATPTPSRYPRSQPSAPRQRLSRFTLPLVGGVIGLLLLTLTLVVLRPLLTQNASVTLIPRSQMEQKTTSLLAAQVHAHQLSATFSQSATSAATGTIPATNARGNLLFQNDTPNPITLQSMTFTDKNGVAISFNGPVTIPPPYKSIPAFAVQAGAAGNIPPLDIAQTALQDAQGNTQLFVKNVTAFAGGANALPHDQVQQSDIDQAANPLITTQKQQAQARLATQVQSNEQAMASTLNCLPTVTSNVAAGVQATSVIVNVTVTCTEEVYDRASVQAQATSLLNAQVPAGYLLAGQVAVSELSMSGANAVHLHAQGQWFYHFSASQLKNFVLLITGKSQEQARTVLIQQTGVADARISGPTILPSANRIQIQVHLGG